jgi:hypothetical protein
MIYFKDTTPAYELALKWFSRRTPTWLETLVHSNGIHNYLTSVEFTPMEKQFLANGLNFICTPRKTNIPLYLQHYMQDPNRGWERFNRHLLNQSAIQELTTDRERTQQYVPKFALVKNRNTAWAERSLSAWALARLQYDYINPTATQLNSIINNPTLHATIHRERVNHKAADLEFIQRLIADPKITIKPADKNLGLVLIDTTWYETELARMLSDRTTYETYESYNCTQTNDNGHQANSSTNLVTHLATELQRLASQHTAETLKSWYPSVYEQMLKFLKGRITADTAEIPEIYLLIKVHKANGLSGRPIVPATNWITTPASVLVDHLLQEILREATIPWIVKDTKSFVNEFEGFFFPSRDGILLTADMVSLYTNIDTEDGLRLVQEFLILRKVPLARQRVIMDLLSFVMRNSYLSFNGTIFHQKDGTAMGTACAPTYANIVVFMLERKVIEGCGTGLFIYRRFLDDIFAYLEVTLVDRFMKALNGLHPKLKFDFNVHRSEAAFLDLQIYKGTRFQTRGLFDLRVHQKKMNLYLYIPYRSYHTDAMKRSFIQTELMRYIRNSSDATAYYELRTLFYQRLRDRGYPASFLTPVFNSVYYDDRKYFLVTSAELQRHPDLSRNPPQSIGLRRRLARINTGTTNAKDAACLSVFVIPYTPLSRLVPTRSILLRRWEILVHKVGLSLPPPLIAYQSMPSLLKLLVFSKARKHRRDKGKLLLPPITTETKATS